MKSLSVESTNILNNLVGMMEDFCVRVDNSEGQYIPVYVAMYNKNFGKRIISIGQREGPQRPVLHKDASQQDDAGQIGYLLVVDGEKVVTKEVMWASPRYTKLNKIEAC